MTTTAFEVVLRRERAVVLGTLAVVAALAWAYVFWPASTMEMDAAAGSGVPGPDMSGMDMSGMDMPGVIAPALRTWSLVDFAFMFAMWAVMMVGMMLPSVAPMLLIYARVARQAGAQGKPFAPTAWFAGGYLLAWTAFALVTTAAQWALESALLLTSLMSLGTALGGAVLIAVGLYQWTPLKDTCLSACQSPLQFIMRHGGFRQDPAGSMKLGAEHGLYCIGCCWLLMAILFVVGVMNLLWIAAIAVFILLEKIVPARRLLARTAGAALVLVGGWMLV